MSVFDPPEYPGELVCDRTGCEHRCDEHDGFGCLEPNCACSGFEAPIPHDDGPENAEEAEAERLGLR